jgi:hypothetical protein
MNHGRHTIIHNITLLLDKAGYTKGPVKLDPLPMAASFMSGSRLGPEKAAGTILLNFGGNVREEGLVCDKIILHPHLFLQYAIHLLQTCFAFRMGLSHRSFL